MTNPATLTVHLIDPSVISVDWSVDGTLVARNAGSSLDVAASNLAPGTHTISARAYDDAGNDLVRQVPGTSFYRRYWGAGAMGHSDKTVSWTVRVQ